jgi:hypothetical protein
VYILLSGLFGVVYSIAFDMPLTGKTLDAAITATAGAGFLLFGYDQGVMSGLLTGSAWTKTFPQIDTENGGSSSLQGTV